MSDRHRTTVRELGGYQSLGPPLVVITLFEPMCLDCPWVGQKHSIQTGAYDEARSHEMDAVFAPKSNRDYREQPPTTG